MVLDFLCVGTYRAGTTWMYKMLEQHPDIWLPNEKEIMFFSHHYEKGTDWYLEFFKDHDKNKLTGEICPTYLSEENSAARIAKLAPTAKIILTLREPSAQIHSLYNLALTRGKKKGTLMQTIQAEDFFLNNVLYYKHLMRFLEHFDREKILVLFYEDMKSDHQAYLDSIYEFLDIEKYYPENMTEKVNYARKPKNQLIENIISKFASFLRRGGMIKIKSQLKKIGIVKIVDKIRKINTSDTQQDKMPKEFIEFVQGYVKEDRENLEKFLGRKLDIWDI